MVMAAHTSAGWWGWGVLGSCRKSAWDGVPRTRMGDHPGKERRKWIGKKHSIYSRLGHLVMYTKQWLSKCGLRTALSPGNLLDMQVLWPHPRLTE